MDENLRFVSFTGNETDVGGRPATEAIGKTRWELFGVDPDEDENWGRHKADLEARRPFRDFRFEFSGADGRLLHLSASGKPTYDGDGRFTGYRGTACDMTVVIESEVALRESEEQLANIVTNLPGRVYRRILHSDGSISFPYVGIGGDGVPAFPPEKKIFNTSEILQHVHPDDWSAWDDALKRSSENLEHFRINPACNPSL